MSRHTELNCSRELLRNVKQSLAVCSEWRRIADPSARHMNQSNANTSKNDAKKNLSHRIENLLRYLRKQN